MSEIDFYPRPGQVGRARNVVDDYAERNMQVSPCFARVPDAVGRAGRAPLRLRPPIGDAAGGQGWRADRSQR